MPEEPYIPYESDGSGDNQPDSNNTSYGDMMADAELPPIREEIDDGAVDTPEAEADNLPPSDVERAMEYLQGAQGAAFGAMFKAVASGEPLNTDTPIPEISGLAEYDRPETEQNNMRSSHEINVMPYADALKAVGLTLGPSAFSPNLAIKNGDKFATMLEALPKNGISETMKTGLELTVGAALQRITFNYIPTIADDDYNTFSTPRVPTDGEADAQDMLHEQITPGYSAAQLLFHADRISDALEGRGIDKKIVNDIRQARIAETEGILGHWAVAKDWGLYETPTLGLRNGLWTQLMPEEWHRVHEFLDDLEAKAPADSQFARNLAETFDTNIQRLLDGDLLPAEETQPAIDWEDDDDYEFTLPEPTGEALAEKEAFEREYNSVLQAVRDRLATIAARYATE